MRNVMMVWYTKDIIGGIPGAVMWKDAIDAASIKIADLHTESDHWDENIRFAAECHAAGLPIEAWAYVYGEGKWEVDYIAMQYAKLLTALGKTLNTTDPPRPRLVLDAEIEYEQNVSLGFLTALGEFRRDVELAPMVMPMLTYRNRMAFAAIEQFGPVSPMLYWRDFSGVWQQWDYLIPDWQGGPFGRGWVRGWTEAAISFYGRPTPTLEELDAFVKVLTGKGVTTCYWWQWQGAPEEWWLAMREQRAKLPE